MRWFTLAVIAFGVTIALTIAQDQQGQATLTLAGSYTVEGMEDKQAYTGRAEVTTEANGTVNIEWFNDKGEPTAIGVGIRDGQILSVIFKNAGGVGLVSYRIDGGKLIGKWTYPGLAGVFPETLTRSSDKLHGADKKPGLSL